MKYAPSGADFYHNFVHRRQPVVIRHGADHWPAVKLWENETYLSSNFGSTIFTVEYRKKFKNEFPVRRPLSLDEFLKIYRSDNVYLDSAFPTKAAMLSDILLPSVLNCHEISSQIESVNLLVNSGDANSALHHDGYENIITMISGTKKVFLINSSYSKDLSADQYAVTPGVLPVDPEKLDLQANPKLAHIPYYEVTLNKGMYKSKVILKVVSSFYFLFPWLNQYTLTAQNNVTTFQMDVDDKGMHQIKFHGYFSCFQGTCCISPSIGGMLCAPMMSPILLLMSGLDCSIMRISFVRLGSQKTQML